MSRLTVITTVSFQPKDGPPTSNGKPFDRVVKTDEQPYGPRRLKVGEEWTQLETGWLSEAGHVVIENDEGYWTQKQPTKEERAEAESKVLELCLMPPEEPGGRTMHSPPRTKPWCQWEVPPRESHRGTPSYLKGFMIRCRKGTARFTVTIYPK